METAEELAETWRRFARVQARGRSPVYEEVAERVAADGPLALLEVGASAGLCLLPDRYGYAYTVNGDSVVHYVPPARPDPRAPVLPCAAGRTVPVVWPGEEHLRDQLRAAIAVARDDPPPVHRGDLVTDLPALAAQAPCDATLVVLHSAVLPYVSEPR